MAKSLFNDSVLPKINNIVANFLNIKYNQMIKLK
jgi:hypothetical protein